MIRLVRVLVLQRVGRAFRLTVAAPGSGAILCFASGNCISLLVLAQSFLCTACCPSHMSPAVELRPLSSKAHQGAMLVLLLEGSAQRLPEHGGDGEGLLSGQEPVERRHCCSRFWHRPLKVMCRFPWMR